MNRSIALPCAAASRGLAAGSRCGFGAAVQGGCFAGGAATGKLQGLGPAGLFGRVAGQRKSAAAVASATVWPGGSRPSTSGRPSATSQSGTSRQPSQARGSHGASAGSRARERRVIGVMGGGAGLFRRRNGRQQASIVTVAGLPFAVPEFRASKLTVDYLPESSTGCGLPKERFYTLTHNDLTGELFLTIGSSCNVKQISGWYNRLVRDEVLAEWQLGPAGGHVLHVHCHVSGEERWLAPPQLRNYIFQREMQLVLDCFVYADSNMLAMHPGMASARVMVHFHADVQALDRVEYWGVLGDRSTWQAMPAGLLERFCAYVAGEGQSCPATNRPPAFQKEEEAAALVDCAASLSGAEQEADAMGSARMVLNPAGRGRQEARKGQGGARYSSNGCGMDCSVPRKPVAVPVLVSASARRGHRQR